MQVGINIKLDVNKIDKSRLFEGKKGKYLDLTTFVRIDEVDEYGQSGFITQSSTKEEREAKHKMPILGNVKVFYTDLEPGESVQEAAAPEKAVNDPMDDLPF